MGPAFRAPAKINLTLEVLASAATTAITASAA